MSNHIALVAFLLLMSALSAKKGLTDAPSLRSKVEIFQEGVMNILLLPKFLCNIRVHAFRRFAIDGKNSGDLVLILSFTR